MQLSWQVLGLTSWKMRTMAIIAEMVREWCQLFGVMDTVDRWMLNVVVASGVLRRVVLYQTMGRKEPQNRLSIHSQHARHAQ